MEAEHKGEIVLPEYTKNSFLGRYLRDDQDFFQRRLSQSPAKKAFTLSNTLLEHLSKRNIDEKLTPTRKTSIICTIGPASRSIEVLEKLITAGMSVARLNLSFGTHEIHTETIENIRKAAQNKDSIVAIAVDIKGPEIRTGNFVNNEEVFFELGNKVRITTDPNMKDKGCKDFFYVDYERLPKVVKRGSAIYVDDDILRLEVVRSDGKENVECIVINAAAISNSKSVSLPKVKLDLPILSEQDKEDIEFCIKMGVDVIFSPLVQDPDDLLYVRRALGKRGEHIKIIAKIASEIGVLNFKDILPECDGVMVARGVLGIELPTEKVSVAQKMIVSSCMMAGKPCIVATQMLKSMESNPRPTRAESSDVANAVMDGTDCVMLSGETAKGKYPLEAMQTMAKICHKAESVVFDYAIFNQVKKAQLGSLEISETAACSAVMSSFETNAKAILVLTNTGRTARLVCKYRPHVPVICLVGESHSYTARQLLLARGALAILYDDSTQKKSTDELINLGIEVCKQWGMVEFNDVVVCVYHERPNHGYPVVMTIETVD